MFKHELEQMGLHPTIKSRVKTFDSYYDKYLEIAVKAGKSEGGP